MVSFLATESINEGVGGGGLLQMTHVGKQAELLHIAYSKQIGSTRPVAD